MSIPCGAKHAHACSSLAMVLEADVPAGAALVVSASAAGHSNWPITVQGQAVGELTGGPIAFFPVSNQVSRAFAVDCPNGLAAGETIEIVMTNAGQGFSTIMWASAAYFEDRTAADLGFEGA